MSTELIVRAMRFAAHKHRNQRRKNADASPYINHPIEVMAILAVEAGIDDAEVLAASLLHDTIEDTETSPEELREEFGEKIAAIVVEMTDDQSLSREERYRLQAEKATRYSPEGRLVRLADKIANIRDLAKEPPPSWSTERVKGHYEQAALVADILRGSHEVLEKLFAEAHQGKILATGEEAGGKVDKFSGEE